MRVMQWSGTLAGLMLATAATAQPEVRELHVVVEVEAQQSWESKTEEFGHQFSEATSQQRYEVRTRLRSDGQTRKRNILNPEQEARLKAKTLHLARQAKDKIEASGKPLTIPETPEQKRALIRRMQEEQTACKTDVACRREVSLLYASIFAAMEYPEAMEEEPGPGPYLYFEPYDGCPEYARVSMQLTIEGERWDEGVNEVVPFTEKRSADEVTTPHEVPLCQRYLAVIDTEDAEAPMYQENFYLPSAKGETVITKHGATRRTTEIQPKIGDVLAWVTAQLKHAPASGTAEGTVRLKQPLNGISPEMGESSGEAKVKLTWRFVEVDPDSASGD